MKNKLSVRGFFTLLLVFGIMISACSNGTTDRNMAYSVQVNNQAAMPRAIVAGDKVELYIANMEYMEDAQARGMMLVAANDRTSPSGKIDNDGWYSINAPLNVVNTINNGPYSGFYLKICKIRVGEKVYDFPVNHEQDYTMGGDHVPGFAAVMGNPTRGMAGDPYPENFSGINMTDSVISLKTVLIIEPDIIGTPSSEGYDEYGLSTDPFKFIKVEGRINE